MKKIFFLSFFLLFISFFFASESVFSKESLIEIYPKQDASIQVGSNENFGSDENLICAKAPEEEKSFIIKFDLSSLTSNITISSAELFLYENLSANVNVVINVYKVDTAWEETTVSGGNQPVYDQNFTYGVINSDGYAGEKKLSIDLSELVEDWIQNTDKNNGLIFIPPESGEDYLCDFGSRESGNKPRLEIKYADVDNLPPEFQNINIGSVNAESVSVNWNTNEKATGFVEYGLDDNYGNLVGDDELKSVHSLKLKFLTPDTVYQYRLISEDIDGNKAVSKSMSFKTSTVASEGVETEDEGDTSNSVAIPENLDARILENGDTTVELTWIFPEGTGLDGFKIYRSSGDNNSYYILHEVGIDERIYIDRDVQEGETNYYRIRAYQDNLESNDSNEVSIKILGSKMENVNTNIFWRGVLLLNSIIWPIFGLWYFLYKRGMRSKKEKSNKRRSVKH